MLGRLDSGLGWSIAFAQRRHPRTFLVLRVLVAAFLVEREIAGEEHTWPDARSTALPAPSRQLDGRTLEPRRRHLARQRAVVDQLVQPGMVTRSGLRAVEIGRADRLVRFLRILDLALYWRGRSGT